MTNAEIASHLLHIAEMLALEPKSLFKVRAYERASRVIAAAPRPVAAMAESGTLVELPGVGSSIAGLITELVESGGTRLGRALEQQYPPAIVELVEIPGITLTRARRLVETLGVGSVEDLEGAVASGRIREVSGFGATVTERLSRALEMRRQTARKSLLVRAARAVRQVVESLQRADIELAAAGGVRRADPICDEATVIAGVEGDPSAFLDDVARLPLGGRLLSRTARSLTWMTHDQVRLVLHVVAPAQVAAASLWHTAASPVRRWLIERATRHGVAFSPTALGGHRDEASFYHAIGLPLLPSEVLDSLEAVEDIARNGLGPLVTQADIRGDLHAHTVASDGRHTLEEMADAAQARGYEYLVVTDHSRSLSIAHGLSVEDLRAQNARIDALNARASGIRILKGSECDILLNGELDYPFEVLEELDVVVASIHSHFRLDAAAQTRRMVAAMEHPLVDVIGHPSGRLLLHRAPCDLDWDVVLRAAARTGTALEMNASPARLDLDAALAARLDALGGRVAIDSDAHSTRELEGMGHGVSQARRARLTPSSVINTRPLHQFMAMRKRRPD